MKWLWARRCVWTGSPVVVFIAEKTMIRTPNVILLQLQVRHIGYMAACMLTKHTVSVTSCGQQSESSRTLNLE